MRPHHHRPVTPLLLALLAAVLLASAACGGDDSPSATPQPASTGDPVEVVRAALDAINRGDIDSAYENLSTEARQQVDLDNARRVLNGLKQSGVDFSVTLDSAGPPVITGNEATFDASLTVRLGERTFPVNDKAQLVRQGGNWRLSDHFLQTAFAAAGILKPTPR